MTRIYRCDKCGKEDEKKIGWVTIHGYVKRVEGNKGTTKHFCVECAKVVGV